MRERNYKKAFFHLESFLGIKYNRQTIITKMFECVCKSLNNFRVNYKHVPAAGALQATSKLTEFISKYLDFQTNVEHNIYIYVVYVEFNK